MKKKKKTNVEELKCYFLACELKPTNQSNTIWSSYLSEFSYDVKPAFIHGTLGVLSYNPESYAILEINEDLPPLLGYRLTISEPTASHLLEKLKGWNGTNAFSVHHKHLGHCFTDIDVYEDCWIFKLSDTVLNLYSTIERVDLGVWDANDEKQIELLEEIEGHY